MEILEFDGINCREEQNPISSIPDPTLQSSLAHYNTYVVGDLHGNFLKLLNALVHFGFIQYTSAYNHYELLAISDICMSRPSDIIGPPQPPINAIESRIRHVLSTGFEIVNPDVHRKEIIFIGDTLCDRSQSDFVTLFIFNWMRTQRIRFSIILGNHEFMIHRYYQWAVEQGARTTIHPVQYPEPYTAIKPMITNANRNFFRSFDYMAFSSQPTRPPVAPLPQQVIYLELLNNFFNHLFLFKILDSLDKNTLVKDEVLLTHAPCNSNLLYTAVHGRDGIDLGANANRMDLLTTLRMQQDRINDSNRHYVATTILEFLNNRANSFDLDRSKAMFDFVYNRTEEIIPTRLPIINIYGHLGEQNNSRYPNWNFCLDSPNGQPLHAPCTPGVSSYGFMGMGYEIRYALI